MCSGLAQLRRRHVCSTPGCPHLTPCPEHGRPVNASWTPDRDYGAQEHFRNAVFARSLGHCERCGERATVAHHVRPGYAPECGLALCDACHQALDDKARSTRRGFRPFRRDRA
jgi:hypothetical protein